MASRCFNGMCAGNRNLRLHIQFRCTVHYTTYTSRERGLHKKTSTIARACFEKLRSTPFFLDDQGIGQTALRFHVSWNWRLLGLSSNTDSAAFANR